MKLLIGIVFALTVLSAPVYIHLQKADATLVTASVEPPINIAGEQLMQYGECDLLCKWVEFNALPYEEQIKDGHYVRTDFGTFMNYLARQKHER